MNGHFGRDAGGYGVMGFGTGSAEYERILEFGGVQHIFKKYDSKLDNMYEYESGDNRSMMTRFCLVKIISSEECVPQHRMVIGRLVIPVKPQKKKSLYQIPECGS